MQFNFFLYLIIFISLPAFSQDQGTKVSYPTGLRLLKQLEDCSVPQWRKYETGLEYVEVKATAKQCQQFSNYIIPAKEPSDNTQTPSKTWGGEGKETQKPSPRAIFKGYHFELINESEIFVQINDGSVSQAELEAEVSFQCSEWVQGLGMPEASDNIPKECK